MIKELESFYNPKSLKEVLSNHLRYVAPGTSNYPATPTVGSLLPNAPNFGAAIGAIGAIGDGPPTNPLLMGALPSAPASNCLYLENLATLQELMDPNEKAEIGDDVREECKKFGSVVDVCVPTPTQVCFDIEKTLLIGRLQPKLAK
jgi:hypothetical protein